MSAVRMVAYGVLEMKHKGPNYEPGWLDETRSEQAKKDDFERDRLRKLVNDELRRYGLLIARKVVPNKDSWRTKNNEHILYGQALDPKPGWVARPVLHEGNFKDCCLAAAKVLDELDAAQIPEGKT